MGLAVAVCPLAQTESRKVGFIRDGLIPLNLILVKFELLSKFVFEIRGLFIKILCD